MATIAARESYFTTGLEVLADQGVGGLKLAEVCGRLGVTTGSFYHYFDSREAFGLELIRHYGLFFARKLDRHLCDRTRPCLERLRSFVADAGEGMARHGFRRGCLIGNLGQEMGTLPESFRDRLRETLEDWQARFGACLIEAQHAGELAPDADAARLAAFFWIGWEGAVLRAKLERCAQPLDIFADGFFASLPSR